MAEAPVKSRSRGEVQTAAAAELCPRVTCCRSGQLQTDCTPKADGSGGECYVAGQPAPQPCDAQQYGEPVKLPILMVRGALVSLLA